MTLRIGSVCTGYGGLDEAVQQVFGGELAWVSDNDPGACQIIAHRMPGVPNLGDLTTTRWEDVEPVDIYIGGYPCQPFSLAGDLKGTDDERHLWPFIASSLRVLRPRVAIFENVANHLRVGFDTVLCDLADLGFDVQWCVVRADEVGAPHQRRRLIFLATATDAPRESLAREGVRGRTTERGAVAAHTDSIGSHRPGSRGRRRDEPAAHGVSAAHPGGSITVHGVLPAGRDTVQRGLRDDAARCGTPAAADPGRGGRRPDEREVQQGQPDAAWGRFLPAVRRWERILGRPAPRATDDQSRLNPQFVEWMMGLRLGHVTAVPELTRTQQLKALGNGVVPQQAAAAIRLLLDRASVSGGAA
ncbi:DNA cytosine methyltransferase [Streptomyces sp. QTS52]